MSITFPCGCVNDFEPFCGIQTSIFKCDKHKSMQREIGELGQEYYHELGSAGETTPHASEFEECFGVVEPASDMNCLALEIGSGASHYVPMITGAGWFYRAVEPSKWAIDWMRNRYTGQKVEFTHGTWEEFPELPLFGLILSAHSLEHMKDAPKSLVKMANCLRQGGVLYIVVPDDSDGTNPDHYWFFNEPTLRCAVENAGLVVESIQSRRRVPHENFIYCKARKV